MHAQSYNIMTDDGNFFDITHSFKAGSSTYHVLGLRKDRPTYRNTYYIFNCTNDEHESTNEPVSQCTLFNHHRRASEQPRRSKQRPLTAHHTTITTIDDLSTNQTQKTNLIPTRRRTRTESPKKAEFDTTAMRETLARAIRMERQTLVASLRKEMNLKKRALLRSIKKEKEELIQATTEANKKDEIIRLLEEHKNSLAETYEKCVNTTASSIDTLKQTLIETLDAQHNTSQSMEKVQLTLIQTIEQEMQKIILKNDEILRSTSAETTAISQLQHTLGQKIDNYSTAKKHDDAVLNHLFAEQKQVLTDVVAQQQQTLSLDLIKQTMIDVLDEQKSTSLNITENMGHLQQLTNDTITTTADNSHSLPRMKSSQRGHDVNRLSFKMGPKKMTDQQLFKVSVRSPEPVHLFAKLIVDGMEYSRRLYTLCQRDAIQNDVFNCYVAPPTKDGPYQVTIYAKTNKETMYRAAICIRLPGSNISQSITFPLVHQSFEEHQCVLIEPFQRLLRQNEQVLIHMIVPGAHVVKIRNGDDYIELDGDEYKNGIVKKRIRVRGDLHVCGCWDKKTDSTICVFNMI